MNTAKKLMLVLRGSGAVAPAFSPTDIAGLVLWLDASDSTTLFQDSAGTTPATADNDVAGKWADKSGVGNHVTQATTANKPLLKLAQQNGISMVLFDGTDDVLATSTVVTNGQAWTAIFVAKYVAGATAALIFNGDTNVGANGWSVKTGAPRRVTLRSVADCNDGNATASTELLTVRRTSAPLLSLSVNGVGQALSLDTSAQVTPTLKTFIGANDATASGPVNAYIAEMLVFSDALSNGDIGLLEAYMNTKWAVY